MRRGELSIINKHERQKVNKRKQESKKKKEEEKKK
jgi:hypothetical protein